ncbi:MAG: TRAP transporter large permease, partial [Cytophagales bacterium]|nr:TRAP transporter large permease [Cytophagales bacterium]
ITSATTGMIIPPSNILIVYSLASGGASIAALFLAGYLPGLLMGLAVAVVAAVYAYRKGYPVGEWASLKEFVIKFWRAVPSLLLLIIVIGGIVGGVFTATEASAIAVVYTLILSMVVYKEVKWAHLPEIFIQTVITTAVVLFLVGTSMSMSWVMSYENIPQSFSAMLLGISDNPIIILLLINLILLFVGIFMDMTPSVLIFTPIFLPVVSVMGMDPVHFGIVMVMNLCIGLCTPPVGSVLFVGCGVAQVRISQVIKPMMPMFLAMIIILMLVTYLPQISLWLPRMFGF